MASEKENKQCTIFEVTPWRNKEEFVKVSEAIFSNDIYQVKWALDRIKVWELRSYPALPAYIDATAALIRAVFKDEASADTSGSSHMYSVALIRFVNIIVECVQNDFVATSTRVAAAKLGIPEWIIDLRHKAAHSSMPPILELQLGAQAALSWLKRSYWDMRVANSDNYVAPKIAKRNDFETYIASYKAAQYQLLCQSSGWSERKRMKSERNSSLNCIKNQLKKRSHEFFEALLKPSVFFIEPKDLMQLLSVEDLQFFNASKSPEFTVNSLELPKPLLDLWAPLVEILNSAHKIPPFVQSLLVCKTSLEPFYLKTACAWALKLIRMPIDKEYAADASDPVARIFKEQYWTLDWFTLTSICAMHPSPYMAIVLHFVIELVCPRMTEEKKNNILGLFALQLNYVFPDSNESSLNRSLPQRLQTWEDVQEDAYLTSVSMIDSDHGDDTPRCIELPGYDDWKEATDIDWSTIPIGHVFGSDKDFIGCPFQPNPEDISAKATEKIRKETSSKKLKAEKIFIETAPKVKQPLVISKKPSTLSTYVVSEADVY